MAGQGRDLDTVTVREATRATAELSSGARSALSSRPGPRLEIARGEFIDRYVVLEQIGAGGMGVVFKAFDPELERRVAIKLLRPSEGDRNTEGRARLVREGQAIAQLAHPNVIAVHDIGVYRDGLFFVAMEFVEGQSLRDWLKAESRSQHQLLPLFIQAGRGLAAAHAKGLIHRDFKPDNVLVGNDGRVRVVDFGLAKFEHDGAPDRELDELSQQDERSSLASSLSATLTRTGDIMGTPAFMSPEQYRGEVGDARTDQFSYCVALYRALCGRSPFKGGTVAPVADGERRRPRPMPPEAQVPAWLERLVMRGLSHAPGDRHASMDVMLAELERERGIKRSTAVAGAAGLVSLILAVAVAVFAMREERKCQGAAAEVQAVWNASLGTAMQQAFVATGRPYAQEAYLQVSATFDAYGDDWQQMYVAACEATQVQGIQSGQVLDLRMNCLQRRLAEVRALVTLFTGTLDASQLDKAVQAAYGLAPIDSCADLASLETVVPPPSDPQARARLEQLRDRLAQSGALESTGKYPQGLEIAVDVAAAADELGYAPLQAEAYYALGSLQYKNGDAKASEQSLYAAMKAAAKGGDHHLVTQSLAELVGVVGYKQARYDAGHAFYEAAMATAGFSDADLLTQVDMYQNLGIVLRNEGRYQEALQYQEKVLKMLEAQYGDEHPYVATALNNIGVALGSQGKTSESLVYFRRALAIGEKTFGHDHPYVTDYLYNIGEMLSYEGKHDEARAYLLRALTSLKKVLGNDHPDLGYVLATLGTGYAEQSACSEALTHYFEAQRIWEASVGGEHPLLSYPLNGIGRCKLDQGSPHEAVAPLERSENNLVASGADPNLLAQTRFLLARALWDSNGDRRRAVELAMAARKTWAESQDSMWHKELEALTQWLRERGR